jgi:hypothetical protein
MARRHGEAALTAHHDCEFREMLGRVGDKWSLDEPAGNPSGSR